MASTGEAAMISAADPLNLVGILLPGERVPALSGKVLTLRDGVPVEEESLPEKFSGAVAM
jgi:ATP-dependent Lhr-like helicase